jgi:hypothetical protein
MSEELEQQMAELQAAQQAIDRDRMWLEWATSFTIDRLHDRSVTISSYSHWLDGSRQWMVEWGGRHLSESGWTDGSAVQYSDRESAYSAYLKWKEQQEEG